MEHVLNLLWFALSMLLAVAVLHANSLGRLRCSLRVALGCTALLALLLFPALSMTDDLQRARLDTESSYGHSSTALLLGTLDDAQQMRPVFLSALLLLLLAAALLPHAGLFVRHNIVAHVLRVSGTQPDAVRPPPIPKFS